MFVSIAFSCVLTFSRLALAAVVPAHASGNASWPYQIYKTVNFTPPYLEFSHRSDISKDYIFLAPDGATEYQLAPLIMDMNGELIWNGPHQHAFNFGVQTYQGQPVLVWWNGTLYPEPIGRGNGVVYVYNQQYELIKTVTLPGVFLEQVPNARFGSNIDVHEVFISSNDTMLVAANNVTQADLTSVGGPADGWVVAGLVYEIDIVSNNVLFSWNSLDHLDQIPFRDSLYPIGSEGYTGTNQSNAWGYFHINAVSPYNGGYLISSRYLCSAIAINKSGQVDWLLQGRSGGDYTLGNGTTFCYQHDVRAETNFLHGTNGGHVTLHMHDNHNSPIDNGTVPSSGKSLLVDLNNKQVKLIRQYSNESGPIYSTAQGNYQVLPNGNVFIGHGWIPVLEEFSRTGEIISTIQFGAAEARPGGGFISAKAPTLSYRAFKQHWTGCPQTVPDIAAQTVAGKTTVYMSWNGATEVEAWQIYGGNTSTGLPFIKRVRKIGFETSADIPSVEYVEVKPVLRQLVNGKKGRDAVDVTSGVVAACT